MSNCGLQLEALRFQAWKLLISRGAKAQGSSSALDLPGKPVACECGLLSITYMLLSGEVA